MSCVGGHVEKDAGAADSGVATDAFTDVDGASGRTDARSDGLRPRRDAAGDTDGSAPMPDTDGTAPPPSPDAGPPPAADAAPPPPRPCETVITYGSAWFHADGHAGNQDVADGVVTWDGVCTPDANGNSSGLLSNGWQPFFHGPSACRIAFDVRGDCPATAAPCATRIAYGDAWSAPDGHGDRFDDVGERVFPGGPCVDAGGARAQALSNGWVPHFNGDCALSFRYTQCGGLYTNPVVAADCPDPGVLSDGGQYVMACTSGGAPDAYPMRTSTDLVHWSPAGFIFPAGTRPAWASGDFWAPEIHRVGGGYVAYFSARTHDGNLALGAAAGPTSTGPFTDLGRPLLSDPGMGLIDVSEFEDANGAPFLVWKEDGNAVGRSTPLHVQALSPDGLTPVGPVTTAIVNDQGWEGGLVEGPFVVLRGGQFFMFYSANAYYDDRYAMGVARSASPLGPWEKHDGPILVTHRGNGAWEGPGHGSVVRAPQAGAGDVLVYHAWVAGQAGGGPGRQTLLDAVRWVNGWPEVPGAPSGDSRPIP